MFINSITHIIQRDFLHTLSLAKNKIHSSDGIRHPNLAKLILAGLPVCAAPHHSTDGDTENQIKDVASLHQGDLTRLTFLDLHNNLLSSLGSVRLPSLTHLYLVRITPFPSCHLICKGLQPHHET